MVISIFCLNLIFGAYDEAAYAKDQVAAVAHNPESMCRVGLIDFYSNTTSENRKEIFGLEEEDLLNILEKLEVSNYIFSLSLSNDPTKIESSLKQLKEAADEGDLSSSQFFRFFESDVLKSYFKGGVLYLSAREAIVNSLYENSVKDAFQSIEKYQGKKDDVEGLLIFLMKIYCRYQSVELSIYEQKAEKLEDCISKYLINEDSLNLTRIGLILAGGSLGVSLYACITDSCKSQGGIAGIVITGVCAAGGKLVETIYKTITTKRKKALEERANFPRTAKILSAYFAIALNENEDIVENKCRSYTKSFFLNSSKNFLGKDLIKNAKKKKDHRDTIEKYILSNENEDRLTENIQTNEPQDIYSEDVGTTGEVYDD